MVICLERGANDLHNYGPADAVAHPIISCFVKIQIGLTFLMPLTQVFLTNRQLNCVSLSVYIQTRRNAFVHVLTTPV